MGRLIDAEEFKNHIKEVIKKQNGKNIDLVPVGELLVFIDREPTAYDLDKVVKRLKEEKEFSYADFDEYVNEVCPCLDAEYDDLFHRGLERAIDIVKAGGVDGN